MIVGLVCFIAGTFFGMVMTALFVAAEDAERCDECVRMRLECEEEARRDLERIESMSMEEAERELEELENERSNSETE